MEGGEERDAEGEQEAVRGDVKLLVAPVMRYTVIDLQRIGIDKERAGVGESRDRRPCTIIGCSGGRTER